MNIMRDFLSEIFPLLFAGLAILIFRHIKILLSSSKMANDMPQPDDDETTNSQPRNIFSEIFPQMEVLKSAPQPEKRKEALQTKRKKEEPKITMSHPKQQTESAKKKDAHERISIKTKSEAKRAFIYSEIFNRKY